MGPIYLLSSVQKMKPMTFVMQISYIYNFLVESFISVLLKAFKYVDFAEIYTNI